MLSRIVRFLARHAREPQRDQADDGGLTGLQGTSKYPALAPLAQCAFNGELKHPFEALARRLEFEAPTPQVQLLLDAGLRLPATGDVPETARRELVFLLGVALLSMEEDGAAACARQLRDAQVPGSEYLEFDLRTPLLDYCRKLGFPWRTFDDLQLRPLRRDADPAAPGIASFLCALPEGMVLGRSFIPAAQTGHAFPEQCIHNVRKLEWGHAPDIPERDMIRFACPSRLLASSSGTDHHTGAHLLLGNTENFGHWMLNHFPRLLLAEGTPALRDAPVVVGDDLRPAHHQCLVRAGIAPERILRLRRGRIASFGELWVPSLLFCGIGGGLHWNPALLGYIRKRLRLEFRAIPKRRIYVGRKQAKWRRLLNDGEVLAALERFGFEPVDPGEMSLDAQIDLAADAQIIVGVFGAGMNLLLFAPEGTPVVELKYDMQGTMDINAALTGALRQPYYGIIGESRATDPDILKHDFTVAADRVAEAVERALDSAGAAA
jgi:hypothetical protein